MTNTESETTPSIHPWGAPFRQFEAWYAEAAKSEPNDPNGMALATAGADGMPSVRMVLLKGHDEKGFVFYTNYESRKGRELADNAHAALLFAWITMERQVVVEGPVARVSREEAEVYFHSRPRASQLAAWASPQSTVVAGRPVIEESYRVLERKYEGREVPLPPQWGGYRLSPVTVEFWQGRRSRLHDRIVYKKTDNKNWKIVRLAP